MVDLMAAVPSIVYGLWGFFLLQPHAIYLSRWLHQNLGWIPIFQVDTDPHAATWAQTRYTASAFIAGSRVSMMVIPLAMRDHARGLRAGADRRARGRVRAGGDPFGMIRTVVLPFGRGGIIGGTMLALGRALGETVAVLLIISPAFDIKLQPLEIGTETVSALIAGGSARPRPRSCRRCSRPGFVLFVITLATTRSRRSISPQPQRSATEA